ncbi:hypothetical protein KI688_003176 [Linnemannia hyalina]|uniref:Uncharacterized protein n=1 Tax=Linnemannia hyalina TaxID=64524 RepID=A0A9P8BQG3_9FUNG|nr:hypothetical protein KI688_003176 [Linnemannia hyalina]
MSAFSTTPKTSWLLCLGLVILAPLAPKQADAHMAMLYPTPRGGYATKRFHGRIHVFVDYKGYKFPCGGSPEGPTTLQYMFKKAPFGLKPLSSLFQRAEKNMKLTLNV